MKKLIVRFLVLIFIPTTLSGQNFLKEIVEYHDNGSPKIIEFKNDDLQIVKKEIYSNTKELESFYNYNPNTGNLNGDFKETLIKGKNLEYENEGKYSEGILNCKFYHQLFGSHIVKGEFQNGNPVGEHKIYKLQDGTITQYDKAGSVALSNTMNQKINYFVNASTNIWKETYTHSLNFTDNGLLNGKISYSDTSLKFLYDYVGINDEYKSDNINTNGDIYFTDGIITGIKVKSHENLKITRDSIFKGSKLFKINNKFVKSPLDFIVKYDYFKKPYDLNLSICDKSELTNFGYGSYESTKYINHRFFSFSNDNHSIVNETTSYKDWFNVLEAEEVETELEAQTIFNKNYKKYFFTDKYRINDIKTEQLDEDYLLSSALQKFLKNKSKIEVLKYNLQHPIFLLEFERAILSYVFNIMNEDKEKAGKKSELDDRVSAHAYLKTFMKVYGDDGLQGSFNQKLFEKEIISVLLSNDSPINDILIYAKNKSSSKINCLSLKELLKSRIDDNKEKSKALESENRRIISTEFEKEKKSEQNTINIATSHSGITLDTVIIMKRPFVGTSYGMYSKNSKSQRKFRFGKISIIKLKINPKEINKDVLSNVYPIEKPILKRYSNCYIIRVYVFELMNYSKNLQKASEVVSIKYVNYFGLNNNISDELEKTINSKDFEEYIYENRIHTLLKKNSFNVINKLPKNWSNL